MGASGSAGNRCVRSLRYLLYLCFALLLILSAIIIVQTFHHINPLLYQQYVRTRLKETTQNATFMTSNQSSMYPHFSLDLSQKLSESPVTHKQSESAVNPRSSLHYSQNLSESAMPHRQYEATETNEIIDRKPTQIILLPFRIAVSKAHRHVLPRAAFFDRRKRRKFNNATVILAHMKKVVVERKLVVACMVDGHQAKSFKVQIMKLSRWIHENHPECTHDNVLILCYDTPGRNNSRVSLVYANPDNETQHFETESEHPLFVPPSVKRSRSSVMACTTVYNSPPYLIEWLHYQRTLGVDLVYINAQQSFLNSKEFNDTFFQNLLGSGFVQLKVWQEYLNTKEVFYHSQLLYYQNCLYRFQGVHDYAIMVDTDDFVITRINAPLYQCLDHLFINSLGSIRLRWVRYYEPKCGLNLTSNLTSHSVRNLTQYVNISSASRERNFKSIHKLSTTLEVKIHEVGELVPRYHWTIAPEKVIYAAHVKKLKLRKDQLQKTCSDTSISKPQATT